MKNTAHNEENRKWLITTPRGVAPTLKRELSYLRYKPFGMFDTGAYIEAPVSSVAHLNLRLRTASKVWLVVKEHDKAETFEDLFQCTKTIDRSSYIAPGTPIRVEGYSHKSTLESERTIQSITHKAVVTSLLGSKEAHREEDMTKRPAQIRVIIAHESVTICINTSGPALHQRGRRKDTGEAPLKENVAAALVLMTSRGYSAPLIDPCCGSGTILIEAAMIATNRAPGMHRTFAFEHFPLFQKESWLQEEKEKAQKRIYDKEYSLLGIDIDRNVLDTARENAKNAGVAQYITFTAADMCTHSFSQEDTIVTNPPYGKRLHSHDVEDIHNHLFQQSEKIKNTTIITGYYEFSCPNESQWKISPLYNGGDECILLIKKEIQ